jgi:8-oxo-dGTP diphosphatase
MEPHYVVAGALLRNGRVLLCHRSPSREWYPDVWDLPGGHVEDSESAEVALVRELAEEIGAYIPIPTLPPLARIQSDGLDLAIYSVETWDGSVRNLDTEEHDQLGWFTEADIRDLQLAHPTYLALFSHLAGWEASTMRSRFLEEGEGTPSQVSAEGRASHAWH